MGKLDDFMGSATGGIAQGVIGQGMGLALGAYNDKRQLKQQEKLTAQQVKAQKEMGAYNKTLEKQMWDETNYGAQMEHIKKAGLNPALLYGTSGGGGVTTGGGGGASVTGGVATQGGGGEAGMGMQLASQMALMNAQKENIEADTANKKAGTSATGTGEALTIEKIATEKLNQQFQEIENSIKGKTQEDVISTIAWGAQKMLYEQNIKGNESDISDETKEQEKEMIRSRATGMILENALKRSGIYKNETEIKAITEQIKIGWERLKVETAGQQVSSENADKMMKSILIGAGINAVGNIAKSLIDIRKGGMQNKVETEVREHGWKKKTTEYLNKK